MQLNRNIVQLRYHCVKLHFLNRLFEPASHIAPFSHPATLVLNTSAKFLDKERHAIEQEHCIATLSLLKTSRGQSVFAVLFEPSSHIAPFSHPATLALNTPAKNVWIRKDTQLNRNIVQLCYHSVKRREGQAFCRAFQTGKSHCTLFPSSNFRVKRNLFSWPWPCGVNHSYLQKI